ncbi:MAG: 2-C-methyl-D-erythritol 4-phosphate cytidylyltransferase [Actinomycetota bacterium]|jgi:2-C-methyl-D-erythritol 4-phosphate cytidylyltransferase/2-C-methyl-D-erythritol 2,4-cyclodiphosphate synthase
MNVAVVLVAAGNGERLGAGIPKALVRVAGKTLLAHSLSAIAQFKPAQLVVVAHEDHVAEFADLVSANYPLAYEIVPGGLTRQGSVANGLSKVTQELVLVHDAARCFATQALFHTVAQELENSECVIPALAVTDTIKEVSGDRVVATLDRNLLRAAQTPQGFVTEKLRQALASVSEDFTDEAALMATSGYNVNWIAGEVSANKITTPQDLATANALHGKKRTGIGTDAHRYSDSGSLVLGCLEWPELPKLDGHSDGDSIAHAIVDALLSAAGLGDIGSNFGVDRPEYSGASGEIFLAATLELLARNGYGVENVAVQVIADQPKIGPRRAELEQRLSSLVGASVSVGATTTDGLGFLSDSRGVAAVATALLQGRG